MSATKRSPSPSAILKAKILCPGNPTFDAMEQHKRGPWGARLSSGSPHHWDRDGEPISYWEWAVLMESNEYRQVARTELGGGVEISTIWLGLDHGFGGGRLLFETMDSPHWRHQRRYATEEEALAGHEKLVAFCRMNPPGPRQET